MLQLVASCLHRPQINYFQLLETRNSINVAEFLIRFRKPEPKHRKLLALYTRYTTNFKRLTSNLFQRRENLEVCKCVRQKARQITRVTSVELQITGVYILLVKTNEFS